MANTALAPRGPQAQIKRIGPSDMLEILERDGARFYRTAVENGRNFTQEAELNDPTSEYPVEERSLDAYERIVKAAGLVMNPIPEYGLQASTWDDCTSTPGRRALMPEFMSRIWKRAGNVDLTHRERLRNDIDTPATRAVLLSGDVAPGTLVNPWYDNPEIRAKRLVPPIPLARLIARTTAIEGDAYRTLYITDDLNNDAYRMKRVAEAADIPATTLVTGERTLRLYKFGRALRASYEQLRRQRVDRIAFIIARMAIQSEVDKVVIALNTLINGDGNANTSAPVSNQTALDPGSSAGTLTLRSWLTFKLTFSLTYQPDILLAQQVPIMQLLTLPIATGIQTPYGLMPGNAFGTVVPIYEQMSGAMEYGISPDMPALKILAFQSSIALERVTEVGGNVSEVDRFINNQTQLLTITEVEGYGTIDNNSYRILNINA